MGEAFPVKNLVSGRVDPGRVGVFWWWTLDPSAPRARVPCAPLVVRLRGLPHMAPPAPATTAPTAPEASAAAGTLFSPSSGASAAYFSPSLPIAAVHDASTRPPAAATGATPAESGAFSSSPPATMHETVVGPAPPGVVTHPLSSDASTMAVDDAAGPSTAPASIPVPRSYARAVSGAAPGPASGTPAGSAQRVPSSTGVFAASFFDDLHVLNAAAQRSGTVNLGRGLSGTDVARACVNRLVDDFGAVSVCPMGMFALASFPTQAALARALAADWKAGATRLTSAAGTGVPRSHQARLLADFYKQQQQQEPSVRLRLFNLHPELSVDAVKAALCALPGATSAYVRLDTKTTQLGNRYLNGAATAYVRGAAVASPEYRFPDRVYAGPRYFFLRRSDGPALKPPAGPEVVISITPDAALPAAGPMHGAGFSERAQPAVGAATVAPVADTAVTRTPAAPSTPVSGEPEPSNPPAPALTAAAMPVLAPEQLPEPSAMAADPLSKASRPADSDDEDVAALARPSKRPASSPPGPPGSAAVPSATASRAAAGKAGGRGGGSSTSIKKGALSGPLPLLGASLPAVATADAMADEDEAPEVWTTVTHHRRGSRDSGSPAPSA